MSLVSCTSKAHFGVTSMPTVLSGGHHSTPPTPALPRSVRSRGNGGHPVLHDYFGLGRTSNEAPELDGTLVVQFANGAETVPCDSLRWLVPVTTLARIAEETGRATAWTVRKANEQGTIHADAIGWFAGHRVHYYDVARVSALIEQLCVRDIWAVGTLIVHSRFGPGKILASAPPAKECGRTELTRQVEFFGFPSPLSISVQELRRLLPSHVIARILQVNSRTFTKRAARLGIYPDYSAAHGRVREFYDESRIDEIRAQWHAADKSAAPQSKGVVLDAEGEIATIEFRGVRGDAWLRYVDRPTLSQTADLAALRELVSLRQLARSERMSRYKLSRLLRAVGIQPVYQNGRTLYFDQGTAHQAVHERLEREASAVTLDKLSNRTGISEAVLARKVRHGLIQTLDHHAAHCVDREEAARVEQVVRALRSASKSLEALSVCKSHTRGRAGAEVVRWDIVRLVEVARTLPSRDRSMLFDQVAWICEGAALKRFDQAFESSVQNLSSRPDACLFAGLLLELTRHLPARFSRYMIRLLLIASGRINTLQGLDHRVRRFAAEAGCDDKRAYFRFRVQIDDSLSELLNGAHGDSAARPIELVEPGVTAVGSVHAEDDCTPGAIIVSLAHKKPIVGIISKVEQQSWNTLSRQWEKTTLVRFAHGEQRVHPQTQKLDRQHRKNGRWLHILLRACEVIDLVQLRHAAECGQRYDHETLRRAS
jgi:hypothetical protein